MVFYLRIYYMLAVQYIKIRMHYRADFIITTLSLLAQNLIGFLSVYVIFHSISMLDGWSFYELTFLYSFALLACIPQQLFFDNVWGLSEKIRSGEFIRYYFKPLNMLFYYMSEVFDIKCLGMLVTGLIMMILSAVQIGVSWTLWNIILLISLLLCASLVIISLMLISGSLGFWFINTQRVLILMEDMKSFAWYPMSIYNKVMKFFFTFIMPIGFAAYYPAQLLLTPENSSYLVYFSPLAGVVLFLLAYRIWKLGINHYAGTGS